MPLKLNDLIKKAKNKGIITKNLPQKTPIYVNSKPWQEESLLFTKEKKSIENKDEAKEQQNANQEQTEDKLGTNWEQTGVTTGNKLGTNWEHKNSNWEQTGNKLGSQLGSQLGTNWEQTGNKLGTKVSFSSLVGLQRIIVIFLYNECKIARSKCTEKLSIEYISNSLQATSGSVKTSIKRLTNKGIIERINFKNGRGGWSKYALSDYLFQELLQNEANNKLGTNWEQTGNKLGSQLGSQLGTTSSIVSSYINNNLLTTTALPEEYKTLDFVCLNNIGFDESHIIQIHREYSKKPELTLSAEIIQNSINAFAFDLKHNNVSNDFKSSPAVVLTYLLKKGQPYSSKTPEKVLTPQEEAMQEYWLAQEKKQQKIIEIKTKARELALQGWLDSLSEDELLNFNQELRPDGIPDRVYQKSRRKKAEELAKDYFDTVLWPHKLKQILNPQVILNEIETQT